MLRPGVALDCSQAESGSKAVVASADWLLHAFQLQLSIAPLNHVGNPLMRRQKF